MGGDSKSKTKRADKDALLTGKVLSVLQGLMMILGFLFLEGREVHLDYKMVLTKSKKAQRGSVYIPLVSFLVITQLVRPIRWPPQLCIGFLVP